MTIRKKLNIYDRFGKATRERKWRKNNKRTKTNSLACKVVPEQTTTILEECALNGWHQSERCLAVMARTAIGQNQTQHISTNQMSSMVLEDWWGLFCNHRTCHLAVTLSHPWTLCIYQSILESSVRSSVWWLDQNWNDNDNDHIAGIIVKVLQWPRKLLQPDWHAVVGSHESCA